MFEKTTAIILAAGKSTRMGGAVKVLSEVHDKPLITYLLDTFRALGVAKPTVVVGHGQALVRSALAGYTATFVDQGEPKGTGHAVLAAKPVIDPGLERAFLCYGDTPFFGAATLTKLYQALDDPTVAASLATTKKTEQNEKFGRIIRTAAGDLQDIVEFKDATDQQRAIEEVNSGCYCVRLPWVWGILEQVQPSPATGEYYLTDLVRIALARGQRVVPVPVPIDEAHGVDTPELLAHVNRVHQPLDR